MNIEQIDKWLNEEYGCSYTRLEELHDYFFEKYTDQKEEIERLNDYISFYKDLSKKQNKKNEELRALYESEREVKEDYKSKVNKAKEYIKSEKIIKEGNTLEQITNYEKNILDILQGSDKE